MKKIIAALALTLAVISLDAQVIELYKDNTLVGTKLATEVNRVKFRKQVLVTKITLSKTSFTLTAGNAYTLTATITPTTADDKTYTWKSSNTTVATVSSAGKVTCVKAGTATITCTASDGSGVSATCKVTVEENQNLLSGAFSVSATKKVQFTKGNLYWNGSAFKFETDQTNYPTSWDATHVSHFFWTNATDYKSSTASYKPYAETFAYSSQSTSDKFWCGVDNPLTVEGTGSLYVLTNTEWDYLFNTRTNASSLYKTSVKVGDETGCLIIAPDGFSGTLQSSYTFDEVNSLGLVCLPKASSRSGSSNTFWGDYTGQYWTATPATYTNGKTHAGLMSFDISGVKTSYYTDRSNGYSIRLVRTK